MVQGGLKRNNTLKRAKASKPISKRNKQHAGAKKGQATKAPKNGANSMRKLERFKEQKKISKGINAKIETKMAGIAIRAGDKLSLKDVRAKGKETNKQANRLLQTRKKGRVEEKMLKFKAKLDREETCFTQGPSGGLNNSSSKKSKKLPTGGKIPGIPDMDH